MADGLRWIQRAIRMEWPVRLLRPVLGKFVPFLPEFRADPYQAYRRLRETAPVYYSPAMQGWVLTRYRDIVGVLSDPRFSVNRQQANVFQRFDLFAAMDPGFAAAVKTTLLMIDPPQHTQLRKLVVKAFTPRRVEQLRPRIEAIVDELLQPARPGADFDVIANLAYPLPTIVIAEMLGVPASDRAAFKRWSDALTALVDPFQADDGLQPAERAFKEMQSYLNGVFADRRREPADDLITALVSVEEDGARLDETALMALVMLLLAAGNETTTNLIGNGLLALIDHPSEADRWRADAGLARTAVEELLRYDSPVQLTDRVATEDLTIDGKQIRKGQLVGLALGAANRDPAEFAHPDRLDFARTENAHLAFGHGVHFCLGAQLARLEAQIALTSLLRKFQTLGRRPANVDWKRSIVLRGPTRLVLHPE